jgi:hypothetical protein
MTDRDVLGAVARLLDAAGIEYAVIGAHAVNAWIEPRFTADIDVTAAVDATSMARLREELSRSGFEMVTEQGRELASGPDFVRFRSSDGVVVLEVQTAKTALQHELIARAVSHHSTPARVATVEDLIVLKLIANRDKDQLDLRGLSRLPGIDWAYVERWAREWELRDLLAALRSQS